MDQLCKPGSFHGAIEKLQSVLQMSATGASLIVNRIDGNQTELVFGDFEHTPMSMLRAQLARQFDWPVIERIHLYNGEEEEVAYGLAFLHVLCSLTMLLSRAGSTLAANGIEDGSELSATYSDVTVR